MEDSYPGGQKDNGSAFHFFLYLVAFFSLGFLVFGVGNILFQFTNKYFPDVIGYSFSGGFDQGAVKFGIASIFIAAPVFFIMMRFIAKYLRDGSIPRDSKVRRWLTYIVLFFAAGTIIGDLITLIMNFLEGDIPARFLLKVLVVLILAGTVLGYYFWDIRKRNIGNEMYEDSRWIARISIIAVVVVFFAGFLIIDSPSIAREKRLDQQTVNDIQNMDSAVHSYFISVGRLPEKIDDLKEGSTLPALRLDSGITYEKTAEESYLLCAVFVRSDLEDPDQESKYASPREWKHSDGKFCFKRIIEKPVK